MSAKESESCVDSYEPARSNHNHLNEQKPAAQNMWYDWWWNYQHSLYQGGGNNQNCYATWCTTCVEEQRMRQARVNKITNEHAYTSSPFNSHGRHGGRDDVGNDSSHNIDEMSYEEDSDDEFEMELNNDFKKFLEQSARHKEQRKKQKEADLEKAKTDDYIEVNEITLEATTVPPTQQQGALRTKEMKTLYGRSAHDIESLETSLQLHFNMNVDMRHPVFWPSIPLKF